MLMMPAFHEQDVLWIEGLKVEALIGVYAHEKINKQPLIIDLVLATDLQKACQSDAVEDTLDYASVSQSVIGFITASQFELIEALSEALIQSLFSTYPALTKVALKLNKPKAVPEAEGVGLMITRARPCQ